MKVTTWKGGTYGIRVGSQNAQNFFNKSWEKIEVKVDGKFYSFSLTPTFWTTCPEFRGGPLPLWMLKNKINDWPKGKPYTLELVPLGENRFELFSLDNR